MSGRAVLSVLVPRGTVDLVETALWPSQADFDTYVLAPEQVSAIGMCAESEAFLMTIVQERRLAEIGQRFREKFPALVRWRDAVIERPRRHRPADVAAAFEALALELTWGGELELAAKAQHRAIRAVLPAGAQDSAEATA
jgi:hypothetical protein